MKVGGCEVDEGVGAAVGEEVDVEDFCGVGLDGCDGGGEVVFLEAVGYVGYVGEGGAEEEDARAWEEGLVPFDVFCDVDWGGGHPG